MILKLQKTIDEIIKFGLQEQTPFSENEKIITELLASIQFYFHQITDNYDEMNYSDPPENEHSSIKKYICINFQDLESYNIPEDVTNKNGKSKMQVSNAVNDLSDIIDYLIKIKWYFGKTSKNNGIFHFKNQYSTHFGIRIINLLFYLYHKDS